MMQVGIVDMGRNGFMNHIMQSEQDTDKIIKACEQLIAAGYNPNIVIEQACHSCGISMNSLTDVDKMRLVKKVEKICQSRQTRRDR